ncbi:mtDNA inheritance, partitioning of the mitochondrial organelle [Entomophthora muscae]|uniref:MtDNA inheritance, partitioning of the mitochondrial organelle n=1 Tax=Entomophthora muscae TaxID=34485 RepID=A0ACC2TZZ2_9FUNG|nr:mtDNA inheritance, partitioning of the mitochondrial organelle [Entomophthora muscae]
MGQEIVTLQFGKGSNSIGAQYWAQQRAASLLGSKTRHGHQEFDRSRLFRGAELSEPRTLVFDLKGTYDITLTGASDGDSQFDATLWRNQPQLLLPERSQGAPGASWSDLDTTVYNPNTPHMIPAFHQNNQAGHKFQSYFDGSDVFDSFEKENETVDSSLRFFTEESDSLQGFQVFVDAFDGFSGFSARYLEVIREEYPKTPVLVFSTIADLNGTPSDFNVINRAMFLTETAKLDCATIAVHPKLALDCISHDKALSSAESQLASSAALAVAIDAALSAARATLAPSSIETIRQTINTRGSTFYSELFTSPMPLNYQSDMPAALKSMSHFPSNEDTQTFSSFTTTRGCALKYNLKDIAQDDFAHKSAIYSSPFSQQPWLGSYTSRDSKAAFGCVASLQTTTAPFRLFTDMSTQTKRFFYSSPAIQNCPDYADLKQTLPYELTDIAENYAKF